MGISYKDAGVDIDKGNEAVRLMKDHVKSTFNEGVLTDIGGFGGLFQLNTENCPEPVLVSGTDGVGTKLKLAILMDKHDTIGIDAVAMCVNDVLAQGAEPLFFLDYVAVGKNIPAFELTKFQFVGLPAHADMHEKCVYLLISAGMEM